MKDNLYTTSLDESNAAIAHIGHISQSTTAMVATNFDDCHCQNVTLILVYRLWNRQIRTHLYTPNITEANAALSNEYISEGVQFYCASSSGQCVATKALLR